MTCSFLLLGVDNRAGPKSGESAFEQFYDLVLRDYYYISWLQKGWWFRGGPLDYSMG